MIDRNRAYCNARSLLEGKSVLTSALEIRSGWIFSFSLLRDDGTKVPVPELMVLRSTGEAGPFFLPDYLEEICAGTKFTDQQLQDLMAAADNK